MKKAMINYVKNEKCDLFQTPPEAVFPILKYIPDNVKTIWECCDPGWSIISSILRDNGYHVISTDKETGFDFLKKKADFHFDMIITNPPYTLKTEFIKKCYEYQKNFALLMPLTALEGKERQLYYRKYGINVVLFDERINFMNEKKGAWFASCWFIWYQDGNNNKIFYDSLYKTENTLFAENKNSYFTFKTNITAEKKKQQNLFDYIGCIKEFV